MKSKWGPTNMPSRNGLALPWALVLVEGHNKGSDKTQPHGYNLRASRVAAVPKGEPASSSLLW